MSVEAGESTHERIAIEVFGMRWMTYDQGDGTYAEAILVPPYAWEGLVHAADVGAPQAEGDDSWFDEWTTDREAAMCIVDRLTDADLQVNMEGNNWLWSVVVENVGGEQLAHATCGYDEPADLALCICRAALSERVLTHLRARDVAQ